MNYLYYFIQASLVVLLIYTIPKIWATTLPPLPALPGMPKLPQGLVRTFAPYQEMIIFLIVSFFTIVMVEKWLKHLFVLPVSIEDKYKDKDKIKLTTKVGTFGTMLMKK